MRAGLNTLNADDEETAENITANEALDSDFNLWGEKGSKKTDELRDETLKELQRFEQLTGISTDKHRREIEKEGNKPGFIYKKLERIREGATKYYGKLLEQSGAYFAEGTLGDRLQSEQEDAMEDFGDLDLSEMVDVHENLKHELEEKKRFVDRFGRQSALVKKQFNDVLRKSSRSGIDYETLLENVLESFGGLEKYPEAVQAEYKKKAESVKNGEQLKTVKEEIIKEYKALEKTYFDKLDENKEYFGGEMVKGEGGTKRTSTHEEFRKWFKTRKNLSAMKSAIKMLPSYISERARLYERRDELLEQANPKDQARFKRITSKMRRHELDAYLTDTLEPAIREDNLLVARYEGELMSAYEGKFALFSPFEKTQKLREFKRASIREQKALLTVVMFEIRKRKSVARRYSALPTHVRDDQTFSEAHQYDRMDMLREALQDMKEPVNLEDLEEDEVLSDEELQDVSESLEGEQGEKIINKALDETKSNSARQALEVQAKVWRRIRRNVMAAEFKDMDQKEYFDQDLAKWTRKPIHLKSVEETNNVRMQNKVRFHEVSSDLFDKGVVTYSSGQTDKRTDISATDLENAKSAGEIEQKTSKAPYATNIFISDEQGKTPIEVSKVFERVMSKTMRKFMPMMMKEVMKELGVNAASASILRKSNKANAAVEDHVTQEIEGLEDLMAA